MFISGDGKLLAVVQVIQGDIFEARHVLEIEDVVDMKLTDVVDKIRGKGGSVVRLEVVSEDGKRKITRMGISTLCDR